MRLPIQYALTYPDRTPGAGQRLDLERSFSLHFEPPDRETFPSLDLGFEVMRRGGTAGAALNAANEAAVARFLKGEIGFLDIRGPAAQPSITIRLIHVPRSTHCGLSTPGHVGRLTVGNPEYVPHHRQGCGGARLCHLHS